MLVVALRLWREKHWLEEFLGATGRLSCFHPGLVGNVGKVRLPIMEGGSEDDQSEQELVEAKPPFAGDSGFERY